MDILLEAWQNYPFAFDLLLYFLFFGAVTRAALGQRFPGHTGKILSIALGLVLAVSLVVGQRALGFSIERLGPIAVLIICLLILIVVYRVLAGSGMPQPLVLVTVIVLVVVLARVTMPEVTKELVKKNPGVIGTGVIALVVLLLLGSGSYAGEQARQMPRRSLERHGRVQGQGPLRQEKRAVKRQLRPNTKKDVRQEKEIGSELRCALTFLDDKGLNATTRPGLLEYCERALRKTAALEDRQVKLLRLDQAIREFDTQWLSRTASINLKQLRPDQQLLLKQAIETERKRINVEGKLESLQFEVQRHTQAMREYLKKSKECLMTWNAAGTAGWLAKALQEEKKTQQLERQILGWERRLFGLLKSQQSAVLSVLC